MRRTWSSCAGRSPAASPAGDRRPGPARARLGSVAGAHRRSLAAPLGAHLARLDAALHGPVRRRGGGDDLARAPIAAPVALVAAAHAWIIPELYAARGASVARPKGPRNERAETVAQGLLGDLLDGPERQAAARHRAGARARPSSGTWLVGEAGALLVRPGGRRMHAFCVSATEADLPPSDRIAHLLLALRVDEEGFATVANHAFAGAPWRVRRRLPHGCGRRSTPPPRARVALASAAVAIRRGDRRRGLRRPVRGAPARASPAAPQRPHRARQRRQLPALHAAAPGRRRGVARAAPRGRPAARGARVGRHPPGPRDRRRPRARRGPRADRRRPRRDAALRPADRHARLGLARAAGARPRRARRSASRRWPTRSPCATAPCSTWRSPSRCPTTRPGASTSRSCSSAPATPGSRASPSCRTTWPT